MKDFLIESYQREAQLLTDLHMLLERERDAFARGDLSYVEEGLPRRRTIVERIAALEDERKARTRQVADDELASLCGDESVRRAFLDALSVYRDVLELDLINQRFVEGQRALLEREISIAKEKQKLCKAYSARVGGAKPVFLDKRG